jgi:hypothetical protein
MTRTKPTKVISKRTKTRKDTHKLIARDRKDLQLKNYLMEEHPELGLPLDGANPGATEASPRRAKSRDKRGIRKELQNAGQHIKNLSSG